MSPRIVFYWASGEVAIRTVNAKAITGLVHAAGLTLTSMKLPEYF